MWQKTLLKIVLDGFSGQPLALIMAETRR